MKNKFNLKSGIIIKTINKIERNKEINYTLNIGENSNYIWLLNIETLHSIKGVLNDKEDEDIMNIIVEMLKELNEEVISFDKTLETFLKEKNA